MLYLHFGTKLALVGLQEVCILELLLRTGIAEMESGSMFD